MFAVRLEADVPQDDHLVIPIHFFERLLQISDWVVLVAAEKFFVGAYDPSGCVGQALTTRIVAEPRDEGPNRVLRLCPGGSLVRDDIRVVILVHFGGHLRGQRISPRSRMWFFLMSLQSPYTRPQARSRCWQLGGSCTTKV